MLRRKPRVNPLQRLYRALVFPSHTSPLSLPEMIPISPDRSNVKLPPGPSQPSCLPLSAYKRGVPHPALPHTDPALPRSTHTNSSPFPPFFYPYFSFPAPSCPLGSAVNTQLGLVEDDWFRLYFPASPLKKAHKGPIWFNGLSHVIHALRGERLIVRRFKLTR